MKNLLHKIKSYIKLKKYLYTWEWILFKYRNRPEKALAQVVRMDGKRWIEENEKMLYDDNPIFGRKWNFEKKSNKPVIVELRLGKNGD